VTGGEGALVITAVATLVTSVTSAVLSLRNGFNIMRIEKNTNSISQRNEDIAKKLGIVEGRQAEKNHPTPP
jgi:uncharacterized oligopeptide transporter (OPT) family protein